MSSCKIICVQNDVNKAIVAAIPALHIKYRTFIAGAGHVETICAMLCRAAPKLHFRRTCISCAPDGGAVSLDWYHDNEQSLLPTAPVLIMLAGFTGGSQDAYMSWGAYTAREAGYRAVVLLARGCGATLVTTPRTYSASDTGDLRCSQLWVQGGGDQVAGPSAAAMHCLGPCGTRVEGPDVSYPCCAARRCSVGNVEDIVAQVYAVTERDAARQAIAHIRAMYPDAPLLGAGWSAGANRLVHYLSQEGDSTPLVAAMSLCNIWSLVYGDTHWMTGIHRNYDKFLTRKCVRMLKANEPMFMGRPHGIDLKKAYRATTLREYDEAVTIKMFGYKSVSEYYQRGSSCDALPGVCIPLMCINALDDPLAPHQAIPVVAFESNPNTILVTTPTGGHLGWMAGPGAPFKNAWTDHVMVAYFDAVLKMGDARQKQGQQVCDASPFPLDVPSHAPVGRPSPQVPHIFTPDLRNFPNTPSHSAPLHMNASDAAAAAAAARTPPPCAATAATRGVPAMQQTAPAIVGRCGLNGTAAMASAAGGPAGMPDQAAAAETAPPPGRASAAKPVWAADMAPSGGGAAVECASPKAASARPEGRGPDAVEEDVKAHVNAAPTAEDMAHALVPVAQEEAEVAATVDGAMRGVPPADNAARRHGAVHTCDAS